MSISIVNSELQERYGLKKDEAYSIDGIPINVEQCIMLFDKKEKHNQNCGKFTFQSFAIELVGGLESNKKTADKGVDGRIWFYKDLKDVPTKTLQTMILSVKGGKNVDIGDVERLIATMN